MIVTSVLQVKESLTHNRRDEFHCNSSPDGSKSSMSPIKLHKWFNLLTGSNFVHIIWQKDELDFYMANPTPYCTNSRQRAVIVLIQYTMWPSRDNPMYMYVLYLQKTEETNIIGKKKMEVDCAEPNRNQNEKIEIEEVWFRSRSR